MRTKARTVASAFTAGLSVVLMGCASNATKRDAAASGAPTTASPTSTTSTSSSVESVESVGSTATSLAPDTTSAAATTTATAAATIAAQPAATTADAVASVTADAAVAGDIPDDQAFIDVTSDGSSGSGGYAIRVPEGWARADGAGATVFSDKFNTIRIETAEMATAPTVGSVRGDELPAVASSALGYRAGTVVAATRKAGAVIVATYQMTSAENAVTAKTATLDVERYEFWQDGVLAIVTLSSAAGSDNVDPWRAVTDGFAWR